MQESTWQKYWRKIRPGTFDVIVCALVTLFVLVAAILPTLVTKYQLFTVENEVLARMAHWLTTVLVGIDNMEFSATIVTFLFWGFIGLITYGIIMGLVHFWQRAEEAGVVASDHFVHPAGFSRNHYWQTIALGEGVNIVVLLVLSVCLSLVAFVLLPATTVHIRALILNSSWSAAPQAVAAGLLLWVGTIVVALCFKAWRYRHVLRPVS